MRLRSTLALVVVVVLVAAVGAWADRPHVAVVQPPKSVPATKGWSAVIEISRRGRRLDGFRPVFTITGEGTHESFGGKQIGPGRYRVQVLFPFPGHYTYTVSVPNSVGGRGSIRVTAN
jgi:hypothetical protein